VDRLRAKSKAPSCDSEFRQVRQIASPSVAVAGQIAAIVRPAQRGATGVARTEDRQKRKRRRLSLKISIRARPVEQPHRRFERVPTFADRRLSVRKRADLRRVPGWNGRPGASDTQSARRFLEASEAGQDAPATAAGLSDDRPWLGIAISLSDI